MTHLSNEAIEEKFQKISALSGWDLQTDDEKEAAEKDAADAQEQLEREQAKEAKAAEEDEETDEEPKPEDHDHYEDVVEVVSIAGGLRRRSNSGRRLFGHPLRTFVRIYHGAESSSVQVVLPGMWARWFW